MTAEELNTELGNIDLNLLDQILKGRIKEKTKILDAGCGEGRNLLYFLKNDYTVYALDKNPTAIKMIRMHARTLGSVTPADNFITGDITRMPFPDNFFEVVMCISVLHFADGHGSFQNMLKEITRVLSDDGILLIKMDSLLGVEEQVLSKRDGIYERPDGTVRYLFTEKDLDWLGKQSSLQLIEPVRYTIREGVSETFLVLRKGS